MELSDIQQVQSLESFFAASAPPITVDELEQVSSRQVPANTFHEYADFTILDLRQADELPLSGAIVLVVGVVAADRDSRNDAVTEPAISLTFTEPASSLTFTEPASSLTVTDSVGNEWSQVPQDDEVFGEGVMESMRLGGPGLVATPKN